MVVCPVNYINKEMVHFYLEAYEMENNPTYQYPVYPTDAYSMIFNVTAMISMVQQNNVKYLLLYENRDSPFMNSNVTVQMVKDMIIQSGQFYQPVTFGNAPTILWVLK